MLLEHCNASQHFRGVLLPLEFTGVKSQDFFHNWDTGPLWVPFLRRSGPAQAAAGETRGSKHAIHLALLHEFRASSLSTLHST